MCAATRSSPEGMCFRILCIAGALAVAACSEGEAPRNTSIEPAGNVGAGAPIGGTDQGTTIVERTAGQWSAIGEAPANGLAFGSGTEPLIHLSCDAAGGLLIDRLDRSPAAGPRLMVVQAGTAVGRLATQTIEEPRPGWRATVPPQHELMLELAQSSEMLVDAGSPEALILPLNQDTAGLVRSCQPDSAAAV